MASRASALDGHYNPGRFGIQNAGHVTLQEIRGLTLGQVAAWPDSVESVASAVAQQAGIETAPGPGKAAESGEVTVLRIEPLKWLLVGTLIDEMEPEQGVLLDLSHSRTHIRVGGERAAATLNRLLPLDLREHAFPVGSAASSAMHHVGVTLWRSQHGYELLLPRGFALASWEIIVETAQQFDAEIV
ncbi:MAG: sarcosine oxidase subunit gamma [Pseudomonadota bacterium]